MSKHVCLFLCFLVFAQQGLCQLAEQPITACTMTDGKAGSCIRLQYCKPYLQIIKQFNTSQQGFSMLRQEHCGFEGENPKVCCPLQDFHLSPSSTTTTISTTTTPTSTSMTLTSTTTTSTSTTTTPTSTTTATSTTTTPTNTTTTPITTTTTPYNTTTTLTSTTTTSTSTTTTPTSTTTVTSTTTTPTNTTTTPITTTTTPTNTTTTLTSTTTTSTSTTTTPTSTTTATSTTTTPTNTTTTPITTTTTPTNTTTTLTSTTTTSTSTTTTPTSTTTTPTNTTTTPITTTTTPTNTTTTLTSTTTTSTSTTTTPTSTTTTPTNTTTTPITTTTTPTNTTTTPTSTTTTSTSTTTTPPSTTTTTSAPVPSIETKINIDQSIAACNTTDGDVGGCIILYNCKPYMQLIKQSTTNPAVARVMRQEHCGFEGKNPKVCCPLKDLTLGSSTTTNTASSTIMTSGTVVRSAANTTGTDFVELPEPPVCGMSKAMFGKVVGGEPAKLGALPWMALLGYHRGSYTTWLCGGSLVSSRHVLTAAHCIHNRENDLYLVRLGELDLERDDDGASPIDVLIKEQLKHEEYSPTAFSSDVAILVLETQVTFTDLIRPICLPRSRELRSMTFERYQPIIAGWGQISYNGPTATHMQVLQLPVVSNQFCMDAYKLYPQLSIDERVLCAGYKQGRMDACQGDSGGPLMQPIYSRDTLTAPMYQIGVIAFGKKCAEPGYPGVYSRVTHFFPWIEEKITGTRSSR